MDEKRFTKLIPFLASSPFIKLDTKVNQVNINEREKIPIYAWIEGPFGLNKPYGLTHDALIIICGGTGISFGLSILFNILQARQIRKVKCQNVKFIWTIRELEHVDWGKEYFIKALRCVPIL